MPIVRPAHVAIRFSDDLRGAQLAYRAPLALEDTVLELPVALLEGAVGSLLQERARRALQPPPAAARPSSLVTATGAPARQES